VEQARQRMPANRPQPSVNQTRWRGQNSLARAAAKEAGWSNQAHRDGLGGEQPVFITAPTDGGMM
jgi:hypothetical protein